MRELSGSPSIDTRSAITSFIAWPAAYILTIVAVNIGFSFIPPINLGFGMFAPMALLVGAVFIIRDFAQRDLGPHLVLLPMAIGIFLSYIMADPYVALASAAAFATSELLDWAVYTITKRPMRERILISNSIAIPVDSVIFLGLVGIFTFPTFLIMCASKAAATAIVWFWPR